MSTFITFMLIRSLIHHLMTLVEVLLMFTCRAGVEPGDLITLVNEWKVIYVVDVGQQIRMGNCLAL